MISVGSPPPKKKKNKKSSDFISESLVWQRNPGFSMCFQVPTLACTSVFRSCRIKSCAEQVMAESCWVFQKCKNNVDIWKWSKKRLENLFSGLEERWFQCCDSCCFWWGWTLKARTIADGLSYNLSSPPWRGKYQPTSTDHTMELASLEQHGT